MAVMEKYVPGTPSWVDLGSPDPDSSASFYGSLFGWEYTEAGPVEAGGYRMAQIGGKSVSGLGPQMNAGMPPFWTTYVSVADAEETVAKVVAAGGSVLMPPMGVMDAGTMAVLMDDSGAAFSIWQPISHIGAQIVNEPNTLCWNELRVPDTAKAEAFYTAVFGWVGKTTEVPGMTYTEFHLDGRSIGGMMPMGDMFPPGVPAHWGVYFAVSDADATVARVVELGGSVLMPAMDGPPGRMAAVADPHGAVFSLIALTNPM